MRYVVLQPDGTYESGDRPAFGLEWLQEQVGGMIEPVGLNDRLDSYINEEGKIHGLTFNYIATVLAQRNQAIQEFDIVVGPVIYTGGIDDEGETVGLDKDVQDALVHAIKVLKANALDTIVTENTPELAARIDELLNSSPVFI